MRHASAPRAVAALLCTVAAVTAPRILAAQGAYGSSSWSLTGRINGQYQSGTVCDASLPTGADTTGFACLHGVASYISPDPFTGATHVVSHDGIVGARADVGFTNVHLPNLGDSFTSHATATSGYRTNFSVYAPGGLAVEGVAFTVRVRGQQSAWGTTYGAADGQCFPLAGFTSTMRFAAFAGDQPTDDNLYSAVAAGSTDTGCAGAPVTAAFDSTFTFIVPLGLGSVGYEITTDADMITRYAAAVYDGGIAGGVSTAFDHTAGFLAAVAVDANGMAVDGAQVRFADPTYVGPLDGPATATPEPASLALVATGGLALGAGAGRRRRAATRA